MRDFYIKVRGDTGSNQYRELIGGAVGDGGRRRRSVGGGLDGEGPEGRRGRGRGGKEGNEGEELGPRGGSPQDLEQDAEQEPSPAHHRPPHVEPVGGAAAGGVHGGCRRAGQLLHLKGTRVGTR